MGMMREWGGGGSGRKPHGDLAGHRCLLFLLWLPMPRDRLPMESGELRRRIASHPGNNPLHFISWAGRNPKKEISYVGRDYAIPLLTKH